MGSIPFYSTKTQARFVGLSFAPDLVADFY